MGANQEGRVRSFEGYTRKGCQRQLLLLSLWTRDKLCKLYVSTATVSGFFDHDSDRDAQTQTRPLVFSPRPSGEARYLHSSTNGTPFIGGPDQDGGLLPNPIDASLLRQGVRLQY